MTTKREYLGDDVYAECDGETLILLTGESPGQMDSIHLEPAVYGALVHWMGERLAEMEEGG